MRRIHRWLGLLALLLIGVAAGSLSLRTSSAGPAPPDIAALVASVQQQNVEDHIDHLSNTIGPRSAAHQPDELQEAADYMESELQSYGYSVTLDAVTYEGIWTFPNVIGVQEGIVCPDRVFIVGAHYDSGFTSPGADDDASGVAGVLEIARALAGAPLPATVWFTGFAMEELGLVGSLHMAQQESAAGTPIVGMYSLDMIAYTEEPPEDSITVIGNEASVRLIDAFERASETYVPDLPSVVITVQGNGQYNPQSRRGDHSPFWDEGYQALFATDYLMTFRNPYYHTPDDTLDTLDLPFATNVTKAMLATTVDYLTYDGDGDTQPDACTGPLAATATPTPTITPTPLPVGGIASLAEVASLGAEGEREHRALAIMLVGVAAGAIALDAPETSGGGYPIFALLVDVGAAAGVLGGAGWVVRRRPRREG